MTKLDKLYLGKSNYAFQYLLNKMNFYLFVDKLI